MATNSLQWQITANRGMSLATREQKAVMTNFVLCRVLCYFLSHRKQVEQDCKENVRQLIKGNLLPKFNFDPHFFSTEPELRSTRPGEHTGSPLRANANRDAVIFRGQPSTTRQTECIDQESLKTTTRYLPCGRYDKYDENVGADRRVCPANTSNAIPGGQTAPLRASMRSTKKLFKFLKKVFLIL